MRLKYEPASEPLHGWPGVSPRTFLCVHAQPHAHVSRVSTHQTLNRDSGFEGVPRHGVLLFFFFITLKPRVE